LSIGTLELPELEDILSSVEITVNGLTATLTSPYPVLEGEGLVYPAAREMPLAAWKEPVNLPKMHTTPFGFVLNLANELRPTRIAHTLREAVVRRHALHVQVFGVDRLVLAYQPMTQLVKEIVSPVSNLFVDAGNLSSSLPLSIAPLYLAGMKALKTCQFHFSRTQKLRGINNLPRRSDKEGFKAKVNTYLSPLTFWLNFLFNFTKDGGKVITGRGFRYRNTLRLTFNLSVEDSLDRPKNGNTQAVILNVYRKTLRYLKGLFAVFVFELRECRPFIEEVVIGNVQTSQGLLKGLGINILEPNSFRLLFKLCQHFRGILIRQALFLAALIERVKVNPLAKEMVIGVSAGAKVLSKQGLLALVRIETKLISLIHYHVLYFNWLFCKSQALS